MTALLQKVLCTPMRLNPLATLRTFSIGSAMRVKEIIEHREGKTLTLEGALVPSPRVSQLVKFEDAKQCYMCASGLDVKHTDVLILSQFITHDGLMLPRRITKLCKVQQKKVGKMVTMAQKAGLMINMTPYFCQKDPTKRRGPKQFNTWYDEKTIFAKKKIPNFDRLRLRKKLAYEKCRFYI